MKGKDTVGESSFASDGTRVYRFNIAYWIYHLAVGVAALVGAVLTYRFLVLAIVLAAFSMFMIYRPFRTAVIVDRDSVTLKGTLSENSIQRSSITAVEFKAAGKSNYWILWGDLDQNEKLAIPDLFAFDDAWDNWFRSYRDLSEGKPLSLF